TIASDAPAVLGTRASPPPKTSRSSGCDTHQTRRDRSNHREVGRSGSRRWRGYELRIHFRADLEAQHSLAPGIPGWRRIEVERIPGRGMRDRTKSLLARPAVLRQRDKSSSAIVEAAHSQPEHV